MDYKDWLAYKSKLENRDVSKDEEDYDLPEYFKTLKATPKDGGHLPDTFKKPNHPTFSDQSIHHVPVIQQGGQWSEEGKFNPSEHNLNNMPPEEMQRYFNEVESPEALNINKNQRFSKLRQSINKKK